MKEKTIKTEVIIVGAGLTGLTLAFYLKKNGISCRLVEKEAQPGGVIRTYRHDGFTFEAGPNTGVLGNLEVMDLFRDLGGACTLEVANPEARRRLIWKDGKWHCLPGGLSQAVTTPLFSFRDKLRIIGEPFRRRGRDPLESVADLVRRRMGNSFLEYAVDPFISGIYAGDPDRLITRYALPKLYSLEQEHGSFIRGAVNKKFGQQGPRPSREVFSVFGGLENLCLALAAAIDKRYILCNAQHTRIRADESGFTLTSLVGDTPVRIQAPLVITTTATPSLSDLLPFVPEEKMQRLVNLEYARIVQVVLGFKDWRGANIRAFGGLVPTREGRRILGILFTSSFLKDRAPVGGALLNVFLGGMRKPEYFDLSDQQILRIVEEEVSEMMRLPSFRPDLVRIFRYSHAIPQYEANTGERLQAIQEVQTAFPGLLLAGNLHEGIGMADRVAQSIRMAARAEHLLELLRQE
jgi:protoporphyrinogen/coproporphyrinogen III oxidase